MESKALREWISDMGEGERGGGGLRRRSVPFIFELANETKGSVNETLEAF